MSQRAGNRTSSRAGGLHLALAVLCLFPEAGSASADRIEGAWELVAYELEGDDVPVSGLLVFDDQEFGMIYAMGQEARFGRAHAGTYQVQGEKVHFEVDLWLQKTRKSAGFVPGKSVAAVMEWRDGGLILRFDGGSVQKLRRIEAARGPLPGGPWEPKVAGGAGAEPPARAALVVSRDRFVLLYLDQATREGQAYGGTFGTEGRVAANWAISVERDSGTVAAGDAAPHLTFTEDGDSVDFRGRQGKLLKFTRR